LSQLLLIGAGGHAKVVIEIFRAANYYEIVGLIDRNEDAPPVLGVPVIGTDAHLSRFRQNGIRHAFIGMGDNWRRLQIGRYLQQSGFEIVNAISPAAVVSASAQLGQGIAVMPGAVINAEAWIGDFAIINTRASVDHECWIAEGVHVGPGSTICGNVTIKRLAFVGAGSTVIPERTIGENAMIGAGACVIQDIPKSVLARGVPARIVAPDDNRGLGEEEISANFSLRSR
jgi:UDP-perosamine 4-acetyltransferase